MPETRFQRKQKGQRAARAAGGVPAGGASQPKSDPSTPLHLRRKNTPAKTPPRAVDTTLPAGWKAVPSESRPGQFSYLNVYTNEKIAWIPTSPAARTEGHVPAPSTNELQAAGFAPTPERPASTKKAEPKRGNGSGVGVDLGGGRGGGGGGGGGREEAVTPTATRDSPPPKKSVMSKMAAKAEAQAAAKKKSTRARDEGGGTSPWFLIALLIAAFAVFLSSVEEGSQFYPAKVAMDDFVAQAKTAVDGAVASAKGLFGAEEPKPKSRWGR